MHEHTGSTDEIWWVIKKGKDVKLGRSWRLRGQIWREWGLGGADLEGMGVNMIQIHCIHV